MPVAVTVRRPSLRPSERSVAHIPASTMIRHPPMTDRRRDAAFTDNAPAAVRTLARGGGGGSFALPAGFTLPAGPGRSLPDRLRETSEQFFGHDFSTVRLHIGSEAGALGARAFTAGDRIVVAPGAYKPDTLAGRQLLGHELAHVVQQRTGRVGAPPGAGLALVEDPRLEAEADRLGQAAAAGAAGPVSAAAGEGTRAVGDGAASPPPRPALQRKIEVTSQPEWVAAQLQQLVGRQEDASVVINADSSVSLVTREGVAGEGAVAPSPAITLLRRLIDSPHTVKISAHDEDGKTGARPENPEQACQAGVGSSSEIKIAKNTQKSLVLCEGTKLVEEDTPAWLILGHELIHADRSARGIRLKGSDLVKYPVSGTWFGAAAGKWSKQWHNINGKHLARREETETVGLTKSEIPGEDALAVTENSIRKALKLPPVAIYETGYLEWIANELKKALPNGPNGQNGSRRKPSE